MADLLGIGRSGLNASKKSLEVTGHNLANVNTEGYSRQQVLQSTSTPILNQGYTQGTGVSVNGVRRYNDEFVDKRLNTAISSNHFYQARADQLGQVESIFNEMDSEGLNQLLNKFFNSFRELANQPENETIRSVVRDTANLVVSDFKRIRGTLDQQSTNIDRKIETSVAEVNQILHHIADLNGKITNLEVSNAETGDLRDQRDLAVRNLAEFFDVHTYVDERNRFIINAQGIGTLVTGLHVQDLATVSSSKELSSNGMNGSVDIVLKDRPSQKITDLFKNGTLSSLVKVRNADIQKLQKETDEIAYQFVTAVNTVHRQGFVNRQIEIGPNGKPQLFDKVGPTSGLDFFKQPLTSDEASINIEISDDIKEDVSNIAAALNPNSPGDNRVAIAISKIQNERLFNDGSITLEEKYLQTIGSIGLESGKATIDAEQSVGILAQANSLRERLSGVSIDEETANMVRYQQAYQASAKIMQAAEEMFKTVLEIKR